MSEQLIKKINELREFSKNNASHLYKNKHPQRDFFIADIFDTVSFRDDIASMEYPLFALKAKDIKKRVFELNGFKTIISPNQEFGMATVHDKDIWIYCISKLCQSIYLGEEVSKTIRFTIYDYLITTNRNKSLSGGGYDNAKYSLDRLASTYITTEIETDKQREARGFHLIDSWKILEEKDGRMVRVEVTLPDWLYRSIISKSVLKISPDYFRLRKPLDRRIYELARKHCGHQATAEIGIKKLYEKSGSSANIREFRRSVKELSESNELPDYQIEFDRENDKVILTNRNEKVSIKSNKNKINKLMKKVADYTKI